MKTLLLAVLVAAPVLAFAQAPGDGRGTIPPGSAADGSRPADGAIKGGSILPGERAGVPDKPLSSDEGVKRCNELGGTLRDQCLLEEQAASTGGTKPRGVEGTKGVAPPDAPPPQNPR